MKFKDYINESSLSRIKDHIDNHSCGVITAYRGDRTRNENKQNNKEVLAVLRQKGYGVTRVKGSYLEQFGTEHEQEVGEVSFFIANHSVEGDDGGELEKDLIKLGEKYDQDSIMSIRNGEASLIGTSDRDDAYPGYGKKEKVGKGRYGKVAGQFFSRIQGRVFTFEEGPNTVMGRWGESIVAKRVLQEMENE